ATMDVAVATGSDDWLDIGQGLMAEYHNGTAINNFQGRRLEDGVNQTWISTNDRNVVNDRSNFSIRYTGVIVPEVRGYYIISTYSDKRVRVWIDGVQVINAWSNHNERFDDSPSISLTAGQAHSIQIDYARTNGDATIQLYWTAPGQSQGLIPTRVLFPE